MMLASVSRLYPFWFSNVTLHKQKMMHSFVLGNNSYLKLENMTDAIKLLQNKALSKMQIFVVFKVRILKLCTNFIGSVTFSSFNCRREQFNAAYFVAVCLQSKILHPTNFYWKTQKQVLIPENNCLFCCCLGVWNVINSRSISIDNT